MIHHDKPAKAFTSLVDELFNSSFNDLVGATIIHKRPAINISDSEDSYMLEVAAPGLDKDNFDISVKDKELTVSADVSTADTGGYESLKTEFDYSSFTRKFAISDEVETDDISATYLDGILKISLQRKKTSTEAGIKRVAIG